MRSLLLLPLLTAACTEGPLVLEITARNSQLVVAQDGDGAWQQVTLDANDKGTFEVTHGAYGVGSFCAFEFSSTEWGSFRFDTEDRALDVSCDSWSVDAVTVSGTTSPNTTIWIDSRSQQVDASGTYSFGVGRAASRDVFALVPGTPPKFIAKRGVDLSASVTLDLPSSDGVDMIATTPIVTGRDPATITISADMNTQRDWISFGTDATTVFVPPASAFLATDHPAIMAETSDCGRQLPLTDAPPTIDLPTPFSATLDRTLATWTADGGVAWDGARITLDDRRTGSSLWQFPSASWLEWAGWPDAMSILDVQSLPGWTTALAGFTAGAQIDYRVALQRGRNDGDYTYCTQAGSLVW